MRFIIGFGMLGKDTGPSERRIQQCQLQRTVTEMLSNNLTNKSLIHSHSSHPKYRTVKLLTGRSDSLSRAHGVSLSHNRLLRTSTAHYARLLLES